MNLKQLFGRNLRFYRLLNGYTQEVFAKIANITIGYVSDIENGKYGPSFDKIEIFSHILKIDPSFLFKKKIISEKKDE